MNVFTRFLRLLEPAAYMPVSQDTVLVAKRYRYWRLRIFITMYVGYIFFYFTRKSFNYVMPMLAEDLSFTKGDLGMLSSILYITYGISKFISGIASDRSNPRFFMGFGLIASGIINIIFGFASSLWAFAILWALNGWVQAWGWPSCTKQLTHWYSSDERGKWWSVCTSAHTVGGGLIPLVVAACITYYGSWRFGMYIPGILGILIGLFIIRRMRDEPRSLGLPEIEEYRNGKSGNSADKVDDTKLTVREILFTQVLSNKYVWILSLSYFFIYIVRTAVTDWGLVFLVEEKHYSLIDAGISISWFEVGGFLGTIVAGWGSDFLFNGRRVPYSVLCSLGVLVSVLGLWHLSGRSVLVDASFMGLIGFFIFGPQMLIGLAAAEFVDKKAAGAANGFAGWFGYVGAAMAGYPLGLIIDKYGWYGMFVVLAICSVIILLILLPMWSLNHHMELEPIEENMEELLESDHPEID
ncbi:MAG: MFS transporter family glucose-6-phosphate receptor UhpC [Legionellales bacterium]|nr:MAG: MFS transporter family glucose-6-phosphate receptor UhpC [Legionellales bacterium]